MEYIFALSILASILNIIFSFSLYSVDLYSKACNYNALTYEDTLTVADQVAPLILPDKDEISAVRFDALMYGIGLSYRDW